MEIKNILVTGGAGYVGAVLVPKLIDNGYRVKVIDLYLYGAGVFQAYQNNPDLIEIKGDIRDRHLLEREMPGTDALIHLACISNDPSYELNPVLGKSINYDAFCQVVDLAKQFSVKRFVYASSSSVYGIKKEPRVTETLPLDPLTDYSRYKALGERYLQQAATDTFIDTIIRPATVCGYSPRLRLDLTVNILTNHAINKGHITVFGGEQKRPNLHIADMTDLYVFLLAQPAHRVCGKIYNVGYHNFTVKEIALKVRDTLAADIPIITTPSDDKRSYHISAAKIKRELGFEAVHTVEDAIMDLKRAFADGKIPHSFSDRRYYNIKMMQHLNMQ